MAVALALSGPGFDMPGSGRRPANTAATRPGRERQGVRIAGHSCRAPPSPVALAGAGATAPP